MLLAPDFRRRFDFLHTGLCIFVDHFFITVEALSRRYWSNTIGRCSPVVMLGVLMVDMDDVRSGNDRFRIARFNRVALGFEYTEQSSHGDGSVLPEDR